MKNIVKFTAALIIVISATAVKAETKDSTDGKAVCRVMQVTDHDIFRVVFQSPEFSQVKIKLYDAKNKLVHTESVKTKDAIVKDFNLSNLPEGAYSFKVQAGDYAYEKQVALSHWTAKSLNITGLNGKAAVVGTNDSGSDLFLSITDEYGKEIHTGVIGKGDVKSLYSFKNVAGSTVTITVKDGYKTVKQGTVKL